MARYPIAIKIANLLVYVFLLGANVYSGLGPESGDSPYRGNHPTYITPASFVFGIWGIIHFLLGGFVIYQFFASNEDLIVDGISWHFVGISLLNALWLVLWQVDQIFLAWITVLITGAQISYTYRVLLNHHVDATFNEKVWLHAPFSLYHAWIVIIIAISTFAAFKLEKHDDEPPSVFVKILAVIALLIVEGIAIGYIEKGKGDIVGAAVIAWSLYGVFVGQDDPVIHWSALVLAVITSFHIIGAVIRLFRNRGSESAPLLG